MNDSKLKQKVEITRNPLKIKHSLFLVYVDDIGCTFSNVEELVNWIMTINDLSAWTKSNLHFNWSKSVILVNGPVKEMANPNYTVNKKDSEFILQINDIQIPIR